MTSPAPVRVVWSREMLAYDFGHGHPMTSERLDLTIRLADSLGLLAAPGVDLVGAQIASDDLLQTVHDPAYVAAVHRASVDGTPDLAFGLGTTDDPVFPDMHEASARVVQGSVDSALAVWERRAMHAVNVTGGLHHAMPAAASGFCVYNDAAVAIRALLAAGAQRVAYVDIDAHHGDGVQAVFWDDPRVLTVSLHETGRGLFPGTGHAGETGGPEAPGTAVNVALPSGTGDAGWLRALDAVVPAVVRAFAPDVLVTQHGCDTHGLDPLTHLRVTIDGQRRAAELLHDLAHEVADGRWVALGGGGYAVVDVVPRAWTHLIGIATHHPVDPESKLPEEWRALVRERYGRLGPDQMTDGRDARFSPWSAGYDPGDDVDRSIRATRAAVFPTLGLDPDYD
ncbi:acetoin utilization protein AcuC [Cellulomonas fengjieae]|uniref:Acetoin utilization protein AcuC n=1 Tax=Cellulomonas fengjieae TaxID=2819978 RepID=A0ABS3SCI1_9CELL|nr:acetoin utilization protein AcuC [Cellulomonas fengjieae]MBO3083454.1 acetoin utilization protein AcuC [Cellulomonas fengjieae]QVI65216.1 acetoin utilization protein AcuC [Cellulomonas fengjieae]